jgi:hypothetical protein
MDEDSATAEDGAEDEDSATAEDGAEDEDSATAEDGVMVEEGSTHLRTNSHQHHTCRHPTLINPQRTTIRPHTGTRLCTHQDKT